MLGTHLLFFHAWGRILESRIRFWEPQVDILARGPFCVDFGVPENILLQGNYFVVGIQRIPRDTDELYGPWDPFGCATLPPNLVIFMFCKHFQFPGKLQVAPVASLLSLVGPLAAYSPLVGTLGCRKRLPHWRT